MIPALLLLARTALAASPAAAPATLPSEKQLRADAHAWVQALCAAGPKDKCEAARWALAGYESLLPETAACESGPCSADRIASLARDLMRFHERAADLPAVAGKPSNDLLRLGALGGVRLAAAASRAKDCTAVFTTMDAAGAAAAVESLCLESPGAGCEDARRELDAVRQEEAEASACAAAPCPFDRVDHLALQAHAVMLQTLSTPPGVKTNTLALFSVANRALDRSTTLLAAFVDGAIAQLKSGADGFEKRVASAEKDSTADARALPGEAQALMGSYQEASQAADRLSQLLGYEKVGAKRDAVNTQVRRLGTLRARAFAAVTARGFSTNALDALAVAGGGVAGPEPKLKPGVVLTTAKPTLLDRRTLPPPSGSGSPPPPIVADTPVLTLPFRVFSKDPLVAADAERRLGLSKTVGTPGTYAKYVYGQAGNDTCAVAAQVQALRAMGLLDAKAKPEAQEKEAAEALARKAYYTKGTAPEYAGEYMIGKGVLVEKHIKAGWPELEAAVKRGSLIQAGIDARELWGFKPEAGRMPHSILITGGEVDKRSGKLLGVYINDSGDDPPKGGRFVSVQLMQRIWQKTFAEVVR